MLTNFLKKDRFPFLLLLVCFLAYGLLIPFLGFYWDDFPYLWFKHTTGILGVIKAIALDRPVLGIFYAFPMAVLGETPWVWQVFAIFCRWIFILSVFGFLKRVFPHNLRQNKYLILLFSVFPGFTQQWISVIYSHAFLIFALYFFSLSLFVDLMRREKYHWSRFILPVSLSLLCLLATEYMAGMEVLRPFIIYKLLSEKYPASPLADRLKNTLAKWAPYLIAMLLFLFYRIFIASSVLYKVQNLDSFSAQPLSTVLNLIQVQFLNIYTATVLAWSQIFRPLADLNLSSLFSKAYLAMSAAVFLVTFFLLARQKASDSQVPSKDEKWNRELLIGSFLSLFFVGIPFWAANLRPEIHFPNDRIFIPFMLGSSALAFFLLWLLKKKHFVFSLTFSLIFSLSLSYQLYQANNYRVEWDNFKQFFQQVSWRIPSLQKNTTLITSGIGLNYYSDNSLISPLNLIYSGQEVNQLDYLLYFSDVRLGLGLKELVKDIPINQKYRTFSFSGNTSQMIAFKFNPPACFQVMDRVYSNSITNPNLADLQVNELRMTDLSLIHADLQNMLPVNLFGKEPDKTWCYYFETADLARQMGDFKQVTKLGDRALKEKLIPRAASEWLPFLEGYSWEGQWDKVDFIVSEISASQGNYRQGMCYTFKRITNNKQFPFTGKVREYLKRYNCQ